MNLFHAAVLGTLQGFTEVLPISSSAHLILIPWLFKWPESGLTFDVALHLGTFLALSLYFWRDIIELVVSFFDVLVTRKMRSPAQRLPFLIIAATVPAAVVGKLFEQQVEDIFRTNPLLIASFLILFGLVLGVADGMGRKRRVLDEIKPASAMTIGLMQCLALIPGVSRSGITITAGLMLGFTRESAARFSFLMSLPIVAGAALLKIVAPAQTWYSGRRWSADAGRDRLLGSDRLHQRRFFAPVCAEAEPCTVCLVPGYSGGRVDYCLTVGFQGIGSPPLSKGDRGGFHERWHQGVARGRTST